ncbi:hypothetical protein KEM56_001493 [Ascosphaera pollenicola]|nr:hypothetical protein KEM56_001493 [Ascosphaera pollenicola]
MPLRYTENTVSDEALMEMGVASTETEASYPLPCRGRHPGQGEKVPPVSESAHATSAPITITGKRDDDKRPRLSIDTKHPKHFTPDFRCSSESSISSSEESAFNGHDDDEPSAPSSATEASPTFPRHSFTSVHNPIKSILKKEPPVTVREQHEDDNPDAESEEGDSDSESDLESEWETEDEEMDNSGVVFTDDVSDSDDDGVADDKDGSDEELEFDLEIADSSDEEAEDDNEDLGIDIEIQFGDDDSGVSFSEKVEYFERYTVYQDASPDEEEEAEEADELGEETMTCHERFLRMQQEKEQKTNNVTFSFETAPEDMSLEMSLLRAHANSIATLPDKDFKTVIRDRTENVSNENDGHIVSKYQEECINSYLEKIWEAFFDVFPRLISSESYDNLVDKVGTVTSFNDEDELVLEEGSVEVQQSLSKEISQTLESWDVRFDKDVIFYVSGKALEPMGRCAMENALFDELSDSEDEREDNNEKDTTLVSIDE